MSWPSQDSTHLHFWGGGGGGGRAGAESTVECKFAGLSPRMSMPIRQEGGKGGGGWESTELVKGAAAIIWKRSAA